MHYAICGAKVVYFSDICNNLCSKVKNYNTLLHKMKSLCKMYCKLGDHHRRTMGFLWAFGGEYKYELVIKHNLYITHILLYNMHLYAELNHCAKNGWYAVLHVYHCYYDEHL